MDSSRLHHEHRVLPMRPASREGLYVLASAWQASGASIRPFTRPGCTRRPAQGNGETDPPEPPPEGPRAA